MVRSLDEARESLAQTPTKETVVAALPVRAAPRGRAKQRSLPGYNNERKSPNSNFRR
jgi:hypothetical protein